ncbi:bifunctional diaminohydroxyphosphoribosylaminopyrimidine deaminase/5-amino-6-(5-phosphoribosylamino)uracil reductase RibD [Paraflavitalea pollutisoli]|uniref:bifunctional diaminohydroxyphosphoribosylaminopyrimidine deaminase/5-amino-6-(5-phosphoribosylamino)uracil reductase RibD n=1 Tax=Paraflavitalea pollutisoli TaxID=3034143 RepID=UPI0023ECD304|nr:bifunctional diaminohydroxyphosphoribosylaminopyrimidine deaminase/5-amino-6-(5-phosphoribosylamino)uracil reductase RibD [Paraflavitalea sp. H1-2-19X]
MHETYLHRCLELARQAAGYTAPNPMVGAVLVHEGRIIGEGWHRQYGGPHAEPNCIHSVAEVDQHLIPQSTLYVSLEPCAHFGKTPPCADLLVHHRIPRVVIGCRDPFVQVDGKGIDKLKAAGVEVTLGVLETESEQLNKRFFTFHRQRRPYIVLKWAQTANGFIGNEDHSRLLISNELTNRLVHQWRSEEAAILVGTNTALHDNPQLNTRHWSGPNPIRLVVDKDLRLPTSLKLFDGSTRTIVFNTRQHSEEGAVQYYQLTQATNLNLVHQIAQACYQLNILSVLVEGGARLLQSFIDENLWDEARIITNEQLRVNTGVRAPLLGAATLLETQTLETDTIRILKKADG